MTATASRARRTVHLWWLGVVLAAWPAGAHAQVFFTPTIDGSNAEWGSQFHYLDGNEADTLIPDNRDIRVTYVANDATYLYFGIETYASMGNIDSFNLYIDRDNDGGGFDSNDRVIGVDVNTTLSCTGLRVYTVDGSGTPTGNGTNVGCNNNYARVGSFVEVRVLLARIGIGSSPTVGVISAIRPVTGSYFNVSPSPPFPTWMLYNNTGTITPTLIRVTALQASAKVAGVDVEWSTSGELLSLGTWVLRQTAQGEWQPVGGGPSPTGMAVAGARYRLVDPGGQAGDRYALAEVDARQQVLFFGPVVASAEDSPGRPIRQQQQLWRGVPHLGTTRGALRSVEPIGSAGPRVLSAPLPPLAMQWPPQRRSVPESVLRVRVFEPGLHVVCDDDLWRSGWQRAVPVVTLQDRPLPVWRVPARLAGCPGHAFYAAQPASPHAPFEAYQLRPARRGTRYPALPEPGRRANAPARSHSVEQRSLRLASPTFIDMGDGSPNRFFRQWVAGFAPLDLAAHLPGAVAGADVVMKVDLRPSLVEPGSVHELVVTHGGGQVSSLAEGPGWRTVELTLPGAASEELALQLTSVDNGLLYGGVLVGDTVLEYPGRLALEQGRLSFEATGPGWALVGDRTSDQVLALDVSDPLTPLPLQVNLVGTAQVAVQLAPTRGVPRRVLVLECSTLPTAVLERVETDPAIDAASTHGEYLVLGHGALLPSLQPLVELRRQQGLSVQVLSLQAVYDRFSFSQTDPRAIAALLAWAREHWAAPPRFMLLVGSTSYDPWGYQVGSPAADAPIQTHWLDSLDHRAWSDSLLVADAAGLPRVAVGRLPSSDPVALARYVAKVVDYEASLATLGRTGDVLALAGRSQFAADPDFAVLASALAETTGLAAVPIATGAPGAAEQLSATWPLAELVLYVGHGDAQGWADDALDLQSPATLSSQRPPVVISATCMDGMFMRPTGSLAWALLDTASDTGASLAISATSLLDPNVASGFTQRLLQEAQGATWGEAWLAAQLASGDEMAHSMVLIGDPALTARLPAPQHP
ncbi:MAG: C25 family cysteine peptidase [Pseudomonadota bacterium]